MSTHEGSRKRLEVTKLITSVIKDKYVEAREAKRKGTPVCWYLAVAPHELLRAFDVAALCIDNWEAVLSAKQLGAQAMEAFERYNYSRDLCGYIGVAIGWAFMDKLEGFAGTPWLGFPDPDFVFTSNWSCDQYAHCAHIVSRLYKCPFFVVDVGYNSKGATPDNIEIIDRERWDYYLKQLGNAIEFLEKQTHTELDKNRLRKVMENCRETWTDWCVINELRKNMPSPMAAEDFFTAFVPEFLMNGTEVATKLVRQLRKEVEQKVKDGIGVIPEEKYRLLWDWVPPWYDLSIVNYFEERWKAVLAFESMYEQFDMFPVHIDPARPLESIARKHLTNVFHSSIERKTSFYKYLVKEYKIDAIVTCLSRRCKPMFAQHPEIMREVSEDTGVPSLNLEMDMLDQRDYNPSIIRSKIDTFMMTLERSKTG